MPFLIFNKHNWLTQSLLLEVEYMLQFEEALLAHIQIAEGFYLVIHNLGRLMPKGVDSKREKLEVPPEILVWTPSNEKEPPIIEEDLTTMSLGSEEASLDTTTDSDEREVNRKRLFWSFLLIPCLVFSNLLIAINWDTEEIMCYSDGDPKAPDSITLDGAEYDLYRFDHDDLVSGGRYRAGDGGCGLSEYSWSTPSNAKI